MGKTTWFQDRWLWHNSHGCLGLSIAPCTNRSIPPNLGGWRSHRHRSPFPWWDYGSSADRAESFMDPSDFFWASSVCRCIRWITRKASSRNSLAASWGVQPPQTAGGLANFQTGFLGQPKKHVKIHITTYYTWWINLGICMRHWATVWVILIIIYEGSHNLPAFNPMKAVTAH